MSELGGFIFCIVFLLFFKSILVYSSYKRWIKHKGLELEIEEWKGTKKPLIWFWIWSLAISFDLVVYILLAIILPIGLNTMCAIAFLSTLGYLVLLLFVFTCIKNGIKEKYNK